jgi:plastocyanin
LYVTSASSVTLQVAGTGSYTVGGGTAPYTVSSSNVSVATATIAGGALTIKGVAAGTAQVVIFDSTGASVLIAITVTSGATTTALYTTAPTSIALAVGGVSTYAIGGGTAPYTASSGSTTVAVANVAGSVLSINGVAAGSAQIQVFDSTGASVAITATVTQSSSPVITVVPDGATGNVGDTLQFLFTGGTAPFTATVTDSSIATLSSITTNTNGGSFSATLVNAGSTNVTIVDSTGQTHNFTLIAAQASTTLRLSPSALVIAEDDVNSISYKIYGGTGPYTAFVSDQLLFSVSTSGSTLTAGLGSNANRCVTPIDSTGTYIPYGTFAVTITVVDSLGASATSTVTIQDNGLGSLGTYGPPCD